MRKLGMMLAALAGVLLLAPVTFAQGTDSAAGGGKGLLAIAATFGMGIAAFGCGLGQGKVGAAAITGQSPR